MAQWTKDNIKKGNHYLLAFNTAFFAVSQVATRFGVQKNVIAGLIEVYLGESGNSYNQEITWKWSNALKDYTTTGPQGTELNDKGFEIVKAAIFAIRNRTNQIRAQQTEDGKNELR